MYSSISLPFSSRFIIRTSDLRVPLEIYPHKLVIIIPILAPILEKCRTRTSMTILGHTRGSVKVRVGTGPQIK